MRVFRSPCRIPVLALFVDDSFRFQDGLVVLCGECLHAMRIHNIDVSEKCPPLDLDRHLGQLENLLLELVVEKILPDDDLMLVHWKNAEWISLRPFFNRLQNRSCPCRIITKSVHGTAEIKSFFILLVPFIPIVTFMQLESVSIS